jgi:hypothetical protein
MLISAMVYGLIGAYAHVPCVSGVHRVLGIDFIFSGDRSANILRRHEWQ